MLHNTKLNIQLHHTNAANPSRDLPTTPIEDLMDKMHCGAISYYCKNTKIVIPTNTPIPFPAQRLAVFHNNSPVVTNIHEFLQASKRKKEREDYFQGKFDIDTKGLSEIDT